MSLRPVPVSASLATILVAGLLSAASVLWAAPADGTHGAVPPGENSTGTECDPPPLGSPYIPVDSWIYAATLRLYSLGFLDHVFLGMRPWTRASLRHMLDGIEDNLENARPGPVTDQGEELYSVLERELERDESCRVHTGSAHIETTYTMFRAITGTPLRDSFHLGSTIVNDYGRPYETGLNDYSGASGYIIASRFTVYARGEFEGAPSGTGYPAATAQTLSCVVDDISYVTNATPPVTVCPTYPQTTIPAGPIATAAQGRFLEAYVSGQALNHVFSFGKQDEWLGPAEGASMAYSNHAENIYAFHVNRIEPLYVPWLSRLTGPFRYEFLVGALRGHTLIPNPAYPGSNQPNVLNPGDPWVHVEKINFRPTDNLEFGFERTALFGGEGHSPVTLHTFLKSFFSLTAATPAVKFSRNDPGARFGSFDFSYRLPFVRNWLTLYCDSEVHDDVSPIDAPRRAAWRPGLYLSHVPGVPKLDVRVEAASTDPPVSTSHGGQFMYWEEIEKQGYTNQGQLFGDWIGREDKGGQGWISYHLSGNEWIGVSARNQKAAKDFVPGGTTLNDFSFQAVKRIGKSVEINGNFSVEHWKAPVYLPGLQTVATTSIQFTWFPSWSANF